MLKKVIFSLATLCFITETSYALPEYILAPVSSKISISAPAFKPLLLSSFPKKFVVNFSLAPSVTVNPLISDDLILLSLKYKKHFGTQLRINSGYRSEANQVAVKKKMIASGKGAFAANPGTSEHVLGTAVDIGTTGNPNTYTWLDKNVGEFGFVRTYKSGCEKITGFPEEKWHYRWIGKENAKGFMNSGFVCITEYLQKLQNK